MNTGEICPERQTSFSSETQDENNEVQPSTFFEIQEENIGTELTQDENTQRQPSFSFEASSETQDDNNEIQPSTFFEIQEENIGTELTQDENIQRQPSFSSETQDENNEIQPSTFSEIQEENIGTELTQDENIQRQPSFSSEASSEFSSSSETQDENIRIELTEIRIELTDLLIYYEKAPIIHKVLHRMRQVNKKAYEPNVISIGPYHHGKKHLKEMEDIKKIFFNRTIVKGKRYLRKAIRKEEKRIRKCYVETNGFSSEEFVKMVVLDGFFIVQLFMGTPPMDLFRQQYFVNEIVYDLLLLENQLPFFVLDKLYKIMTKNKKKEEFADLVLRFFEGLTGETNNFGCSIPKENIKHLLGLIHDTPRWCPSKRRNRESGARNDQSKEAKCIPWGRKQKKTEQVKRESFIRCASELEEAGISFEKRDAEDGCRALDIEFKSNGSKAKLRIPKLNIDEHTERMLSNLIAFEQFLPPNEPTYVLDYVKFLDQLIDTKKDVQLLCNADIFENRLGDDEIVAQVFNLIGDHVYVSGDFHYSDILKQVNKHYYNSCNRHMANLNRNYFNTPWALLSFLAAVLLLFLTFAQTTFTLFTDDCRSCVLLYTVCGVLLVVIALFSCWRFS